MNRLDNVLYKVSDLQAAKALHSSILDAEPHTDKPFYVGFQISGIEIGLTPTQPGEAPGVVAHIRVPELEASIHRALDLGATLASEPREVGGGHRVAAVRTPDGAILGLIDGPERVV